MPIAEDLAENFRSWHVIAADPALAGRLGGWERANLPRLADLESRWQDAARGETLLHADLRSDNLLLTPDGGVMVVDWPYAVAGAAWVDALLFLISAAADGGADPASAWESFGPARSADPAAADAVLAAAAGDFTLQTLLPPPPNLPSLRGHQRRKAAAATGWRAVAGQVAVR